MKCSFFQAAIVSIYGCTTWTLTKQVEKKLDGNYTRILRAILKKSWRQHLTKQQLYGHLPPITKTIQVRRTRHAGHTWRRWAELISDDSNGPLHMAVQKQGGQLEPTYSSSVRIRGVALGTCRKQWTIRRVGERGSGLSVLMARQDNNNNYYYYHYYYQVFHISVRWWFFHGVWVKASLLKSPGLVSGFVPFLAMLSFV